MCGKCARAEPERVLIRKGYQPVLEWFRTTKFQHTAAHHCSFVLCLLSEWGCLCRRLSRALKTSVVSSSFATAATPHFGAHQLSQAWVRTQGIESEVGLQTQQTYIALLIDGIEPLEGLILILVFQVGIHRSNPRRMRSQSCAALCGFRWLYLHPS